MSQENFRIIARLDIKGPNLIKGINLEGLRIIGNPNQFAYEYYKDGIDEIVYIDSVASLYGRNNLTEVIKKTVKNIYVPITVGGGVRSVEDARQILRFGADKIAVNTAAVKNPKLIQDLANEFGSQCIVSYIEAKKTSSATWQVYVENGRQPTDYEVKDWAIKCQSLGAGEILLTSIDKEGTGSGFDIDLNFEVSSSVDIPVIASGGMGTIEHILNLHENSNVSAVAMADVLHYKKLSIHDIRNQLSTQGINVRTYA